MVKCTARRELWRLGCRASGSVAELGGGGFGLGPDLAGNRESTETAGKNTEEKNEVEEKIFWGMSGRGFIRFLEKLAATDGIQLLSDVGVGATEVSDAR